MPFPSGSPAEYHRGVDPMADLVFVSIVAAFFAVAGGLVLLCDRLIGPGVEGSAPVPLLPVEASTTKAA